jgi:presenilin-like A22 family membrane protease
MLLENRSHREEVEGRALNTKFKPWLIHLTPILASLLVGLLCAYLISVSSIEIYPVAPFPEGAFGSFGNALYFVILAGVGASLLYLLLKRKSLKLITLITGFALTTAVLMLSIIYLFAAFSKLAIPNTEASVLISALLITVIADFAIFRTRSRVSDLVVIFLGGALGTFLGVSIPTLSAVLILVFLAIYDLFAVYRGPVGKIAYSGLEQLRGLSFAFKDIQMGLGDLTFYSMLSGHVLINFGLIPCMASVMGILFGCLLAFKMLEKKGMFPGLPFPILLGLTAALLSWLIP